jgi:hypothetical protein
MIKMYNDDELMYKMLTLRKEMQRETDPTLKLMREELMMEFGNLHKQQILDTLK